MFFHLKYFSEIFFRIHFSTEQCIFFSRNISMYVGISHVSYIFWEYSERSILSSRTSSYH